MQPIVTKDRVWEGQNVTFVARMLTAAGAMFVQADITSVTCKVFDLTSNTPDTAATTLSPAVSSVFFNTAQTDGYWGLDNTGYNFRHTVTGSAFPKGGRRYRVEYEVVTGSHGSVFAVFEVQTDPRRGG